MEAIHLARQIAAAIAPRAAEADTSGELPPEDVQLLRESGYLTLNIPVELGGLGLDMRECVAAHLNWPRAMPARPLWPPCNCRFWIDARWQDSAATSLSTAYNKE